MTRWRGSWARLAPRRLGLIAASAVIVIAVVTPFASGLPGASYVIGFWAGPRTIGVGTEGADALAVSPDGGTLYAANTDEDEAGDSDSITVVKLPTGQAGKRIGIGGLAVKFVMMPGGRTLYALVELDDGSDRLVRVGLAALRADAQSVFRPGAEDMVAAPGGSLFSSCRNRARRQS